MNDVRNPVVRVEYVRVSKEGVFTSVIYEVAADGTEGFFEHGFSEVRWYPFEPSAFERQLARRLRDQQRGKPGYA